jgi:hypothetical protein
VSRLTARQRAKLQRLIDKTAAASTQFQVWNNRLCEFSRETYGFEPGDIDADSIIDQVQGGCGLAPGMSADDFDQIMREGM